MLGSPITPGHSAADAQEDPSSTEDDVMPPMEMPPGHPGVPVTTPGSPNRRRHHSPSRGRIQPPTLLLSHTPHPPKLGHGVWGQGMVAPSTSSTSRSSRTSQPPYPALFQAGERPSLPIPAPPLPHGSERRAG